MTARKPVVLIDGTPQNIPSGDTLSVSVSVDPPGVSEDLPGVSGTQATSSTSTYTIGSLVFDPSLYPTTQGTKTRAIKFAALAFATPSMTAEVTLYNVTDGAAVTAATLTTSSNSVASLLSAALTVPTDLPNSSKLYDIRLRISAGTPGDTDAALVRWAGIKVIYS